MTQNLLPASQGFYRQPLRNIVHYMLDNLDAISQKELEAVLPQYGDRLIAAGKAQYSEPHQIFGCSLIAAAKNLLLDANQLLNPNIPPWTPSIGIKKDTKIKLLSGETLSMWLAMRQHLQTRWQEEPASDNNASLAIRALPASPAYLDESQLQAFQEALNNNDCNVFSDLSLAVVGGCTVTPTFTSRDDKMPAWRMIFSNVTLFNDEDGRLTVNNVKNHEGQFDFVISSDVFTQPSVSRTRITLLMDMLLKQDGHHVHVMCEN